MPIGKIGQRRQVVIPKDIFDTLGLKTGDFVEVTQVKGTVVIKPKRLIDADEEVLTPRQKAAIDKRLAEAMDDVQEGRVYGPFASVDAMLQTLNPKKSATQRRKQPKTPAP